MKRLFDILFFLILILSSSTSEIPRKLPSKIDLNEMIIYNTKENCIELKKGWVKMNRDSLLRDADEKILNIKKYK